MAKNLVKGKHKHWSHQKGWFTPKPKPKVTREGKQFKSITVPTPGPPPTERRVSRKPDPALVARVGPVQGEGRVDPRKPTGFAATPLGKAWAGTPLGKQQAAFKQQFPEESMAAGTAPFGVAGVGAGVKGGRSLAKAIAGKKLLKGAPVIDAGHDIAILRKLGMSAKLIKESFKRPVWHTEWLKPSRIAKPGVPAVNLKTKGLVERMLRKTLSKQGAAIIIPAASSMILGLWGQAEAAEPVSIAMTQIEQLAETTGDWSLYWEASEARDELTDLTTVQKIMLWTPLSAGVGIPSKMEGIALGGMLLDKLARATQEAQEQGLDFAGQVRKQREEKIAMDTAYTEWWNEQNRIANEGRLAAQTEYDNAKTDKEREIFLQELQMWEEHAAKQRELEAKDREAIAEFWLKYNKMKLEKQDAERPSNLNFGLL